MNRIVGAFEKIKISGLPNEVHLDDSLELIAKIDTGAFSGVIHAENIELKDEVLCFDLMGDTRFRLETKDFKIRKVRNTHGGSKKRYLVNFEIEISGDKFNALLGLDDRSKMKFDMLLGRAFLNKYKILVDTHRNIELDEEWQKMGGEQ